MIKKLFYNMRDWIDFYAPKCPICNGNGGEQESVLDDGSGPFYPCHACNRTGKIYNPIKWLYWNYQIRK